MKLNVCNQKNNSDFDADSPYPQNFNQQKLNDFIWDLNLWNDSPELLASRLNENNALYPGSNIIFYHIKDKDLLPIFFREKHLLYL